MCLTKISETNLSSIHVYTDVGRMWVNMQEMEEINMSSTSHPFQASPWKTLFYNMIFTGMIFIDIR